MQIFLAIVMLVCGATFSSVWFAFLASHKKYLETQKINDRLSVVLQGVQEVHNQLTHQVQQISDKLMVHDMILAGKNVTTFQNKK